MIRLLKLRRSEVSAYTYSATFVGTDVLDGFAVTGESRGEGEAGEGGA